MAAPFLGVNWESAWRMAKGSARSRGGMLWAGNKGAWKALGARAGIGAGAGAIGYGATGRDWKRGAVVGAGAGTGYYLLGGRGGLSNIYTAARFNNPTAISGAARSSRRARAGL